MAEADASAAGPLNEPIPGLSPSASTPTSTQAQQSSPAFVAPSDYLRPRERSHVSKSRGPMSPLDHEQLDGLVSQPPHSHPTKPRLTHCLQRAIREFLKARTSYDVLPLSYRLIVFDTALLVKKSLNILIQNGMHTRPSTPRQPFRLTSQTRHCLRASLGLQDLDLRRPLDHLGLHQCHSILLAESRCPSTGRPVPPQQSP